MQVRFFIFFDIIVKKVYSFEVKKMNLSNIKGIGPKTLTLFSKFGSCCLCGFFCKRKRTGSKDGSERKEDGNEGERKWRRITLFGKSSVMWL